MKHFKILITTGKKQNIARTLFVRAHDITAAMDIRRKVRKSQLRSIHTISYEEYMTGVDEKYKSPVYERDF